MLKGKNPTFKEDVEIEKAKKAVVKGRKPKSFGGGNQTAAAKAEAVGIQMLLPLPLPLHTKKSTRILDFCLLALIQIIKNNCIEHKKSTRNCR